jgi:hypothetical protein
MIGEKDFRKIEMKDIRQVSGSPKKASGKGL